LGKFVFPIGHNNGTANADPANAGATSTGPALIGTAGGYAANTEMDDVVIKFSNSIS
jgi:hypothetical protein